MIKPSPRSKVSHAKLANKRPGFKFSPFVNMRGKVYGSWLVNDFLYSDDHEGRPEIDPETGEIFQEGGWTDYWWSASCLVCKTTAALERRAIRKKNPQCCPTCRASERIKRETEAANLRAAQMAAREQSRARRDLVVTEMTKAGHSQSEIGAVLGLTYSAISCRQKALGLKPAMKDTRKYKTEQEQVEALRRQGREAYARLKVRTGRHSGPRGRPRKSDKEIVAGIRKRASDRYDRLKADRKKSRGKA